MLQVPHHALREEPDHRRCLRRRLMVMCSTEFNKL
jgi:hypothetical protein